MYSLLNGLYKWYNSKIQYNILFLGIENSGKTTILEQLRHIYLNTKHVQDLNITNTIGLNLAQIDIKPNNHLIFWDVGGEKSLRVLWKNYYKDTYAIIYVINYNDLLANNKHRLSQIKYELNQILNNQDDLKYTPILLYINQYNQQHIKESINEILDKLQLNLLHIIRPIHIELVNGYNGKGLKNGMIWLLKTLPQCQRTKLLGTLHV